MNKVRVCDCKFCFGNEVLLTERGVFRHYDTYGMHSNGQPNVDMIEDCEADCQLFLENFHGGEGKLIEPSQSSDDNHCLWFFVISGICTRAKNS